MKVYYVWSMAEAKRARKARRRSLKPIGPVIISKLVISNFRYYETL
jgi:hypothetical protein